MPPSAFDVEDDSDGAPEDIGSGFTAKPQNSVSIFGGQRLPGSKRLRSSLSDRGQPSDHLAAQGQQGPGATAPAESGVMDPSAERVAASTIVGGRGQRRGSVGAGSAGAGSGAAEVVPRTAPNAPREFLAGSTRTASSSGTLNASSPAANARSSGSDGACTKATPTTMRPAPLAPLPIPSAASPPGPTKNYYRPPSPPLLTRGTALGKARHG